MITENASFNRASTHVLVAVEKLIDTVAGEALGKLSCLSLGSQQAVRAQLRALINKAQAACVEGGPLCTGAWETDETFVVAISIDDEGTSKIAVSLCLGEARITA